MAKNMILFNMKIPIMKTQSDLNEDIIHLMIKLIPERNKKKDKQKFFEDQNIKCQTLTWLHRYYNIPKSMF